MSGSINETGKVLAATTTVSGAGVLLANSGLRVLGTALLILAILGAAAVAVTSLIRRIMVRGR